MALALLAFLIRLIGIGWGLPNHLHNQSYHPDEFLLLAYASHLDLGHGIWDPQFYNYGSLWLYVMSVTVTVAKAWGLASDVGGLHLACRAVAAALGSATVGLVFLIGRRMSNLAGGIVAAAVLALAPAHVVHSRFHTVDVPATFFVAASVLLALKAFQDERKPVRAALWAGVMAGLAAAVKYNMALAVLPALLAVGLTGWPARRKLLVGLGVVGCAVAAFLLTTPGFIFSHDAFMRDFTFELRHAQEGHGLVFADTPPGWLYHIGNLFEALGAMAPLVGLIGIVLALRTKNRAAWVLLAFALPYYAMIGSAEVKFLRYVLPLAPFVCAFAGSALASGAQPKLLDSRWSAIGIAALAFGALMGNNFAVMSELMVREDPRDHAAEWLMKNASGASIGFPSPPWFYTPPLFPDTDGFGGVPAERARLEEMASVKRFRLVYYWPPDTPEPVSWDPRLIAELKPDYVVASSFETDDLKRLRETKNVDYHFRPDLDRYIATRRLLDAEYTTVALFGTPRVMAHDMMYVCPRIVVWKRK